MNDEELLIKVVLEAPNDALPRLVYADYIEERGRPEWAEFIRLQCEYALLGECPPSLCCVLSQSPKHWCTYQSWHEKNPTAHKLERRMHELFGNPPTLFGLTQVLSTDHLVEAISEKVANGENSSITDNLAVYKKGFVAEVYLKLFCFIGYPCARTDCFNEDASGPSEECPCCNGTGRHAGIARSLFKSQPIEKVVITNKKPSKWLATPTMGNQNNVQYMWERDMSDQPDPDVFSYLADRRHDPDDDDPILSRIPGFIFDMMEGESGDIYFINKIGYRKYSTITEAHDDLSKACHQFAYELVRK